MITLMTIITALGCLMLMAIIPVQDSKTGDFNSGFGKSGFYRFVNQGKSSLILERATWTMASVLFVLCIITAVLS